MNGIVWDMKSTYIFTILELNGVVSQVCSICLFYENEKLTLIGVR